MLCKSELIVQHPAVYSILPCSASCYAVYAHSFKLALHKHCKQSLPRVRRHAASSQGPLQLMASCCHGDRWRMMTSKVKRS
jgi:hypothetical protein